MVTPQPKDDHPPEGSMLQAQNLALRLKGICRVNEIRDSPTLKLYRDITLGKNQLIFNSTGTKTLR